MSKLIELWYRLLAWGHDKRRDAILQVELVGTFHGRIERIVEVHGAIVVFTNHGEAYRVWYDYNYIGLRMQRFV
jgi:hypothetical protein